MKIFAFRFPQVIRYQPACLTARLLMAAAVCTSLSACGGGNSSSPEIAPAKAEIRCAP